METRKLQLLLHPLFILSLTCLLLNDLYWKYEYHNWITGKLSDFAGLFVLSIFLFAFFPRHRSVICACILIFFTWWKSPLSQPFIDLLNDISSISFRRAIDYSDLFALPVAFAPYFIKTTEYKFSFIRKVSVFFISTACFIAFCSTSMYRKFMISPDLSYRVSYNETYPTRFNQEDIMYKLDSLQISYKLDSFTMAPLRFYGGTILAKSRDSMDKNLIVLNPDQKDTAVYFRIDERPYIAIYNVKVKDEIIPQVNIRVQHYPKYNDLCLESVVLSDEQFNEYYGKMSKTKKKFRKLIEEGLIRKLK